MNPVGRCALVNSDYVVVNIVMHNGDPLPDHLSNHFLINIDDVFCGVGFIYDPIAGMFIDTREASVG